MIHPSYAHKSNFSQKKTKQQLLLLLLLLHCWVQPTKIHMWKNTAGKTQARPTTTNTLITIHELAAKKASLHILQGSNNNAIIWPKTVKTKTNRTEAFLEAQAGQISSDKDNGKKRTNQHTVQWEKKATQKFACTPECHHVMHGLPYPPPYPTPSPSPRPYFKKNYCTWLALFLRCANVFMPKNKKNVTHAQPQTKLQLSYMDRAYPKKWRATKNSQNTRTTYSCDRDSCGRKEREKYAQKKKRKAHRRPKASIIATTILLRVQKQNEKEDD